MQQNVKQCILFLGWLTMGSISAPFQRGKGNGGADSINAPRRHRGKITSLSSPLLTYKTPWFPWFINVHPNYISRTFNRNPGDPGKTLDARTYGHSTDTTVVFEAGYTRVATILRPCIDGIDRDIR